MSHTTAYDIKPEHEKYLDSLCDETAGINTRDQALRYVLNQTMQREMVGNE